MKKIITFSFVLASVLAHAQEGTVGINTMHPKATLEVQPSTANLTGTTNEGIIAPKLSKERIAAIATPVEGTLVYATDATYAGSDVKVAKITEKGYYFYNGTEWVKSGNDLEEQVWKYDGTRAYIDKAIKDKVEYLQNGGYRHFPRTMRPVTSHPSGVIQDAMLNVDGASIYNWRLSFSDLVTGASTSSQWPYKSLNEDMFVIDENETSSFSRYYSNFTKVQTNQNTTRNFHALYSQIGFSTHYGSGHVARMIGGYFASSIYNGSANEVSGGFNEAVLSTTGNVYKAIGAQNGVSLRGSGAITTAIGSQNQLFIEGLEPFIGADFKSTVDNVYLTHNVANLLADNITGGAITNMMGTYTNIQVPLNNPLKVTNLYGLYITDILNATDKNYSIYTNAGQVRFGDLAGTGNREVYVDENGVLKAKTTTIANNAALWVEDIATNSIKLAVNSDGTTRTNAVSITDGGMVLGSSFRGTNGATIFPDYVFQKYYTGNSSIKADYTFKSLSQVEDFVKTNGHLPGYKSAAAIKAQGYVDLMETQLTNVEKIEELYLHTIELKKENEELKSRLEKLEKLLK
ncbi:hypothetical protein ACFFUE_04000 [Bergeyella porcorum]|uniref:hypothetical protein n=1 Tax=Bergeyella porcorum TaxID=1735111 RepID=UPI0035EFA55A